MLARLFRKSRNVNEDICPTAEFQYAMRFVRIALEESQKEERNLILNFVADVIRNDSQYDLLTQILYKKYPKKWIFPFPLFYYDKNGKQHCLVENKGNTRTVDLAKECVLTFPYDMGKMIKNVKNIGIHKFQYQPDNHFAYFFSPLNVCYVCNGYHSISAGTGLKKGSIEAVEYDISGLFGSVYTDGAKWYDVYTKEVLCDLPDFRIGILFEIYKEIAKVK